MSSASNGGEVPSTPSELLNDWTVDPETGRSNSSRAYYDLVYAVERLIRQDAHKLIAGRADATARLIVSQLAHVHGMVPRDL